MQTRKEISLLDKITGNIKKYKKRMFKYGNYSL